jgi:DNA-binding SARP family transcriptional activator
VARSDLLDLLWPESPPRNARHRLRQALYQLKKLGAPLDTPDSVVAVREAEVECDYLAYSRNRQAVVRSAYEATRLDYLPHYTPTFSPRFAKWVEAERDRVAGTLRRCILDAIVDARTRGDHTDVIALARASRSAEWSSDVRSRSHLPSPGAGARRWASSTSTD